MLTELAWFADSFRWIVDRSKNIERDYLANVVAAYYERAEPVAGTDGAR